MVKTEPTIITLTVLPGGGSHREGTLLIQRGELAKVSQFTFGKMSDITTAIHNAVNALAELELEPPKLTEAKRTEGGQTKTDTKRKPATTTIKKGKASLDDAPDDDEEADAEAGNPEAEAEVEDDSDQLPLML